MKGKTLQGILPVAARTNTNLTNIDAEIAAIGQVAANTKSAGDVVKQKLDKLLNGSSLTDVAVDLKGDFEASVKKEQATQENLAKLVQSLNEVSKGLTDQFKSMSTDSFMEWAVGVFSKERSEVMKAERIRKASITESLNELVQRSDKLLVALKELLVSLERKMESTLDGQKRVNERYELGEAERVALNADIERLTLERNALQATIAGLDATVPSAERAALETDFAEISNTYNEATERLQTRMAVQQKLAGHRESYSNYTHSLAMVIATQKTLIAGLEIDTEESTTLFDTLTEALKASKQQEYASQINLASRVAHSMGNELMLQISASSRNNVVNTMNMDRIFAEKSKKFAEARAAIDADSAKSLASIQAEFEKRGQEGV
jgi:hypothetical protein